MKIVIQNRVFPYDLGCRVLKMKNKNVCPFEELEDVWDKILPLEFGDIARIENIEMRRIAFLYYDLEKLVKEVNPTLLESETIEKETTWVNENGELVHKTFSDTYELYEVKAEHLFRGFARRELFHYIKFKDTSTDREYMIWVDLRSVTRTNSTKSFIPEINPIQCIAWTITTNVPKGRIKEIIRQGDCILIKPKRGTELLSSVETRHLTEKEYRELLTTES